MSVPKVDPFVTALQSNCLFCKFGYSLINEYDDIEYEYIACMRYAASGLKSKKFADVPKPNREFSRTFCPIMNCDETCESFKPIDRTSRKFKFLERCGLFYEWED